MSERGSRRKNRRYRSPGSGQESRWESVCLWLATLIASGTVAVSPWFLGGAIPHAQLILQCGAVGSSLFCLAGGLTGGHVPRRLPEIGCVNPEFYEPPGGGTFEITLREQPSRDA